MESSLKICLVLICLIFLSVSSNANANNFFSPYDEIYMVEECGSYEKKIIFGWEEEPCLYLQLSDEKFSLTLSFWNRPEYGYFFEGILSKDQDIWLAPADWNEVRKAGEWEVEAFSFSPFEKPIIQFGSTEFSVIPAVVPEPISSILFISGGTVLMIRRYRKK